MTLSQLLKFMEENNVELWQILLVNKLHLFGFNGESAATIAELTEEIVDKERKRAFRKGYKQGYNDALDEMCKGPSST